MRKFKVLLYFTALFLIALIFTGCQDSESEEADTEQDGPVVNSETDENSSDTEEDESESTADTGDSEKSDSNNNSSNKLENDESNISSSETEDGSKDDDVDLSKYSSEEIEYARIWHQLGPNPEIDKLYVIKKPAGTPLRPNHEDVSATYPEDVIMLKGTRIVDGAVTYSGNGDGTINRYKVPVRWNEGLDGETDKEAIKNDTERIVEDTEKVEITAFANEEIINYIEKIEMD
ncbi:hypothetical protein [Lentibacillus sp. CBA3610]|uniref:hypothetical protein n=1 Tax=Lentibacillus sp. CBA3610 TaxID=2518176 RepID=UPI0015962F7E|nr:hypothetical protein [Lentibacillus sp. CBA3610]QKY71385.1 hypothetical protein Len3610_19155 [Lentibacillus sp. CBA3610]